MFAVYIKNIHTFNTIINTVFGRVPWYNQYWPCEFIFCVVLCPGSPEDSTGSGSDFKAYQKTGP